MKQKKYHYAVLEIAMYNACGPFFLERTVNDFGADGWKIISVDEKFIIMEREYG